MAQSKQTGQVSAAQTPSVATRVKPQRRQRSPQQGRTISILVPQSDLKNARDTGLIKLSLPFLPRPSRRIQVEGNQLSRADSVFYAPFRAPHTPPPSATQQQQNCQDSEEVGVNREEREEREWQNESQLNIQEHTKRHRLRSSIPLLQSGRGPKRSTETDELVNGSLTPVQFVDIVPELQTRDLVRADHDFELSFVGMHIPPKDTLRSNNNELLLFSLKERLDTLDRSAAAGMSSIRPSNIKTGGAHSSPLYEPSNGGVSMTANKEKRKQKDAEYPIGLNRSDFPYIHYDPVVDAKNEGSRPDTFEPVPDSKAIFYQSVGSSNGAGNKELGKSTGADPGNLNDNDLENVKTRHKTVPVRFTLLEVDQLTTTQVQAVAHIDKLEGVITQGPGPAALPFSNVLSSAVEMANSLGRKGLKRYARPDHVMTIDFEFKLAPPLPSHPTRAMSSPRSASPTPRGELENEDADTGGNEAELYPDSYLRYGYYFFLREKVDAKLYAQTDTSHQHVPLLMRRIGPLQNNEQRFFPLSGVSFVVVKVAPGCSAGYNISPRQAEAHQQRLEHILNMGTALGMLSKLK